MLESWALGALPAKVGTGLLLDMAPAALGLQPSNQPVSRLAQQMASECRSPVSGCAGPLFLMLFSGVLLLFLSFILYKCVPTL